MGMVGRIASRYPEYVVPGRRRSLILVTVLGVCSLAIAVGLQIGWIVLNWQTGLMLVLGILFFGLLIAGVTLNMIFLIREVKRNEQHDSFINAVTHELKTPVASIRLYLETLKKREPEAEKRREFYDVMLADSDRLLGTIEQILQAGRERSARKLSHKIRINMTEMVRDCIGIARLRHHLRENSIEFSSSGSPFVEGDITELKAAIFNLLENAIKYSGAVVRIKVHVARKDEKVIIRVRDEGIGIPDQELKRIFKRFYRIPGVISQRIKGTGLGLFIVKSIVNRHGGKVMAESAGTGHGSTFTMELPAA